MIAKNVGVFDEGCGGFVWCMSSSCELAGNLVDSVLVASCALWLLGAEGKEPRSSESVISTVASACHDWK
jgi:hypothetical protein